MMDSKFIDFLKQDVANGKRRPRQSMNCCRNCPKPPKKYGADTLLITGITRSWCAILVEQIVQGMLGFSIFARVQSDSFKLLALNSWNTPLCDQHRIRSAGRFPSQLRTGF
jgi:hypothetical protein